MNGMECSVAVKVLLMLSLLSVGLILAGLAIFFTVSNEHDAEGIPCKLADDVTAGICMSSEQCPSLNQLNSKTCGFSGEQALVCCPEASSQLISRFDRRRKTCEMSKNVSLLSNHLHGGSEAEHEEFPYMAALGYPGSDEQFLCGASIVSERFLLTAAHCIVDGGPIMARFGVALLNDTKDEPIDIEILRSIPHPEYRPRPRRNDIALLELARPINFTETDFLTPICLFENHTDPAFTVSLTIAGWGLKADDTPNDNKLMKATVHTIPNDACKATMPRHRPLQKGQLCAQNLTADGEPLANTCKGDSGGPLQLELDRRRYLVGVTSIGLPCITPNTTGIYTRVADYLDWIESIVWDETFHVPSSET